MKKFVHWLALWMSVALCSPVVGQTRLQFEPCQVGTGAVSLDAECATLARPENPSQPDGAQVELFVAKFPARVQPAEQDALTVIQGGPGASSIDLYVTYRSIFQLIARERDVLVVDQRGTGRSNLLSCAADTESELEASIEPAQVRQLASQCLNQLGRQVAWYTTSVAVEDLEAVRSAAGYDQLTLYGVSYGTRVAQHYARRFSDRVRAMVLDGVVPVGVGLAGGEVPLRSQQALDQLLERCTETPACDQRFGDLGQKFELLRQRLRDEPVWVHYTHPTRATQVDTQVTETHLLWAVRMLPYSTESLSLLPLLIDQAYQGNYQPLMTQVDLISENFGEGYATAMSNTVICSEDLPRVDERNLALAEHTYFGLRFAEGIAAMCEVWPRGPVDTDFYDPIHLQSPVLILSGEVDPITPPSNGEAAHAMFQNSLHLVAPGQGHGVVGRGCTPHLVREFVVGADLAALQTDCIARERALPLFSDFNGPTP